MAGLEANALAMRENRPALMDKNGWQAALVKLALAWAAIGVLFWRDWADMFAIWWDVSTYNHILLIPFILGWLVVQRQEQVARIAPITWSGGLLPLLGGALLWILGEAGGFNFFRHLALIVMLQSSVLALLGWRVSLALLFPIAYAFFLVPLGEEMVPALQTITADMSMVMLGWAGIPAHIEGVFISTPTGYFEVAEACSGVKFLIAMLAYGVLVAHVCFKSWPRRIAFVAVSVIVPIIANGIRAWGTIYIAHYSSNDFAAGFDHIFYGWIFFAVVLVIVMALGWRFFDRKVTEPFLDEKTVEALAHDQQCNNKASKPVLALVAAFLFLPVGWTFLATSEAAPIQTDLTMPVIDGWTMVEYRPLAPWKPQADGANATAFMRYQRAAAAVDVFVAVYDGQEEGREVSGYGQGALDPASDWAWASNAAPVANGRAVNILAPGPVGREVLTFYVVGNTVTGSNLQVKLETMKARILGQPLPAAVIIVSAERRGEKSPREMIDGLLEQAGGIEALASKFGIAVAGKAQ